ncbi:MAG: outer membrane beta-barrel protein [Bacteroidota bacterium]
MRSLLQAIILLISLTKLSAQTGKIRGTILDSVSHKTMAFATIMLQQADTIVKVKTTVSNENGIFVLGFVQNNKTYTLHVSMIGYQNKTVSIPSLSGDLDLGQIFLTAIDGKLNNVTVTSSKPLIKQEIDRLTYDVQADPLSKGQSAMDMLRRVPLLTVDADDNLELQGSGSYLIFLNGRPSGMLTSNPKNFLRSMSASLIQKIEVITTPPAKYDAEGLAGIINIVTLKKMANGYTGTFNLRQNIPNGLSYGLNTTFKQKKWGISFFGGGLFKPIVATNQESLRKTFGLIPTTLSQSGENLTSATSYYVGTDISYEVDSLHLFTSYFNISGTDVNIGIKRQSILVDSVGIVQQSYKLQNDGRTQYANIDLGLNYQLGFRQKKDAILTTSYRYSYSLTGQFNNLALSDFYKFNQPDNSQLNDAGFREHTFQLDYVLPLKKITLEAGAKTILRDNYSNSSAAYFLSSAAGYVNDPARTNNFNYQQNIVSLYNSYNIKFEKFTVQAGVRGEFTHVNADFTSSATKLDIAYANIIPTVSILKPLPGNNSISFGITNRLMRPGITQLNPFIDHSNPQFISTGNPGLKPVISHLFEFGYNKIAKGSLNIRLSYLYTNSSIESVTRIIADTLSLTTYENVGQSKTARINVTGNYPLSRKLNLNFNTGIFYVWIKGTYNGRVYSNQGPRTNTFISSNYKFNNMWQIGASFGYNRRYINLQGSSNDFYYSSISSTCTLKQFTFNLILNNPFMRYYSFTAYSDTPDFYQSNTAHQIYRTISFSATYKFGKLNSSIKKNKRGITNDDVTGS